MSAADPESVLVVGAGIFGITAARALRQRGLSVTLVDPGPLPHPDAASTDISKIVRADYGSDGFYTELMEEAFPGWARLNDEAGRALYHETGFVLGTRDAMGPGSFEHESFALLSDRGYALQRLDAVAFRALLPAWAAGRFCDGYLNPRAGWVESGAVVAHLLERAAKEGVTLRAGARVAALTTSGVRLDDGEVLSADRVVIAAGTWTPALLPELGDRLSSVGQPVLHFDVSGQPSGALTPPAFLPWAADIATTGWYGFANIGGVLKVANHGVGVTQDPHAPRAVPPGTDERFRAFVQESLPSLSEAPVVARRLCFYSDAFDGDFFIASHPARAGVIVAAGGSGHGFKFAPVLGELIADVTLGTPNPWAHRFAWRQCGARRTERARFDG